MCVYMYIYIYVYICTYAYVCTCSSRRLWDGLVGSRQGAKKAIV